MARTLVFTCSAFFVYDGCEQMNLEPSIIVAGASLFQLLARLSASEELPASLTCTVPVTPAEASQKGGASEASGIGENSDRFRDNCYWSYTASNAAEPPIGVGSRALRGNLRPSRPFRVQELGASLLTTGIAVDGSASAWHCSSQSSFVTAESRESPPSSDNGLFAFGGLGCSEPGRECRSTPRCSASGPSIKTEASCSTPIISPWDAVEGTACKVTGAGDALSWFWTLVHSLDGSVLLGAKIECIQLESSSVRFTVEDLDVRVALE